MALITQMEYAKTRGVSRQYISKLVKKGIITLVNGRINPLEADRAIEQSRDPARVDVNRKSEKQADKQTERIVPVQDKSVASIHQEFFKARTKKEIYRAEKEQIECEQLRKKLIDVDKVAGELEKVVTAIRSKLLALPDKLAKEIKNLSDLADIQKVLKDGVYECLTELSDIDTAANDDRENPETVRTAAETDSG